MSEEILDLSALAPEREKARIRWPDNPEGEVFELAVPEDFGAVTLTRIGQLVDEEQRLSEKKNLTAADGRRMEKILNEIAAKLVIGAPPEAIEQLPAITKRMLGVRFFVRAGTGPQAKLANVPISAS